MVNLKNKEGKVSLKLRQQYTEETGLIAFSGIGRSRKTYVHYAEWLEEKLSKLEQTPAFSNVIGVFEPSCDTCAHRHKSSYVACELCSFAYLSHYKAQK